MTRNKAKIENGGKNSLTFKIAVLETVLFYRCIDVFGYNSELYNVFHFCPWVFAWNFHVLSTQLMYSSSLLGCFSYLHLKGL